MGSDTKKCVCDSKNGKFVCGKHCKNKKGINCVKNEDCQQSGGRVSKIRRKTIRRKTRRKRSKLQRGRGKSDKLNPKYFNLKNEQPRQKALEIARVYGNPHLVELDSKGYVNKVTWHNIEGANEIIINNRVMKKLHPHKAVVFIVVGKYTYVPEHLFGPLKYASETINIEQIFVSKKDNDYYQKTGNKRVAMVYGSCASITISAITIKFVEDMVKKYRTPAKMRKSGVKCACNLNKEFREEYDKRVDNYLRGKGIVPSISWFRNRLEKYVANKKFI